jgi:tRNA dimethylallyltransferase
MKKKVIAIIGPTAIGKSSVAVSLAKAINGEIVSADSRQVYQGMNIGSGKITQKEKYGIRHHLLDITSPKKRISVVQYVVYAKKAIEDINSRGKVAILCGGTGFYIEELLFPSSLPKVPPNKKLRSKLEKKNAGELFNLLRKKDPRRAKNIDPKNKVRLVRALEIIHTLGKVPLKPKRTDPYKPLIIELDAPIDFIKSKISKRLLERLYKGMLGEINLLHKNGLSWKSLEAFGLEYKWGAKLLQKKVNKIEFILGLEKDIVSYAKRQKTWFKKMKNDYKNTVVISVNKKSSNKIVLNTVKKFLK